LRAGNILSYVGKKMADVEVTKEDLELDIAQEKRARKILLICSAVGLGIGLITGVALAQNGGGSFDFNWMWLGIGLGGALTKFFKFGVAYNGTTISSIFWLVLFLFFLFAGPIALLIRFLRMNYRIKKFEEQLIALGQ